MMADLSLLPVWYGKEGDYVLVDRADDASRFISALPHEIRPSIHPLSFAENSELPAHSAPLQAAPWGFSPQSIRLFETLRQHLPSLSVPRWDEALARLTHRHTAVECLKELSPPAEEIPSPQIFSDINGIRKYVETHPLPCIVKTPYSCSGRGVYWIRSKKWDEQTHRRIDGALKKQHSVSIETAMDKVCDFAMEFESGSDGEVIFRGLSVFDTSADGAYGGNLLGSSERLAKRLEEYVSETDLDRVREAVRNVLTGKIGTVYKGFLGVDMLIYRKGASFGIHPFIELNLRRTMGHVCLQLSNRLIHPSAQGRFVVACQPAGEAFRTHQQMKKRHPLQIVDGRIRSGYFSLCPVMPETRFRAYILLGTV
jgi:hypothetical protein